jgi:hypothetical protein
MTVPYNNGKVKIGINYQPKRYVETDTDMLMLQSYLIEDPARLNRRYWLNKLYLVAVIFLLLAIWLYN